jgi:hypothetical protein
MMLITTKVIKVSHKITDIKKAPAFCKCNSAAFEIAAI